jgi:hypothetical protein
VLERTVNYAIFSGWPALPALNGVSSLTAPASLSAKRARALARVGRYVGMLNGASLCAGFLRGRRGEAKHLRMEVFVRLILLACRSSRRSARRTKFSTRTS